MVLQRGMPVPLWGTGDSGEEITVTLQSQSRSVVVGGNGKWKVRLDPLAAGGPFTLAIRGKNGLVIGDVLVGEVWLCGGQSNMDYPMGFFANNADTARVADIPGLRFLNLREGRPWAACTPVRAEGFSAAGFYFGRELHRRLGVPVGIIESAVGGSPLEAWMDPASVAADPSLAGDTAAGALFRSCISPLVPFAMRGTAFYQGESNVGMASEYRRRFPSLIAGWRKAWGQGDFPFLFVQLPNIGGRQKRPGGRSDWAELRDAQRQALEVPNTGMAVAIDIGDPYDIHPHDKRSVGLRLALPALALTYGQKDLIYSGPLFETLARQGSRVHLRFRHVGGGLVAKGDGTVNGFALTGGGDKWAWAKAEIHGDTVTVWNARVPTPLRVRYAWHDNPIGNLCNAEGLPASPFEAAVPAGPGGAPSE